MFTNRMLAVAGALLTFVTAVPLNHKRDLIIVTRTHETVVTVAVTTTVWLDAGETASTAAVGLYEQAATSSAIASPQITIPAPVVMSSLIAAPSPIIVSPQNVAPTAPVISVAPVQPTTAPVVESTSEISSAIIATTALPAISTPVVSAPASPPTSVASGTSDGLHTDDITEGPAAAGRSYVGDLTNYTPGMGACGIESGENDHIVAIAQSVFDYYVGANPNDDPICKQWIEITGVDGTIYPAQIMDSCPGCSGSGLDLPLSFFNLVTANANGRAHNIHWQFAGSA